MGIGARAPESTGYVPGQQTCVLREGTMLQTCFRVASDRVA